MKSRRTKKIWQSLYDDVSALLKTFGEEDYFGKADYLIVDDDWGWDFLQIELHTYKLLVPHVIAAQKKSLPDTLIGKSPSASHV